jgi:hypothetical protein
MNTEVKETSKEDKFLGITTSIEDMLPKKDDAPKEEIIVEKVEDTPEPAAVEAVGTTGASDDDITQYGDKVQKRFKKMTWQTKEAERERDSVAAERDEAYRVAKTLNNQNQQQAQLISTGEARLVQEIKGRAFLAVEQAKNKYKAAYSEGNTEAILAAQEEMINAQADNKVAVEYGAEYDQRVQNWAARQQHQRQYPQQYQQQQPQAQPQVRKPTQESQSWASENTWFGDDNHRDMTAIAYATHETMIRDQGVKPDSPEYFETLNATMRHRFPEYFVADTGTEHSQSTTKPHAVVAPATRSTGANQRTVKLNASQRSLAKAIGITEEQYAKQLLKENTRG